MKINIQSRKKKHKKFVGNFILELDFECNQLRKQLKSVNDKTTIRKLIFKTSLQEKYRRRLQLLNF
tara:strand:- start:179 stop:376 length:198 start_codon:yes stop_codon:yes gene_type:complete